MQEDLLDLKEQVSLRTKGIQNCELLIFFSGLIIIGIQFYGIFEITELFGNSENETYIIIMVSQSILFCIHVTPIIYTFLWRSASVKYDNQETEKKPDNGLIFLFYMLSYFVVIISAGLFIYSLIDLISSFSYIENLIFVITELLLTPFAISLYIYYL